MYIVDFFRTGFNPDDPDYHYNLKQKGKFTKQFETLSDVAKYYVESNPRVNFVQPVVPYYFSKREWKILVNKIIALRNKKTFNGASEDGQ